MAVLDVLSSDVKEELRNEMANLFAEALQEAKRRQLEPRMLTKQQACKYLNISYPTFEKLRKEGHIKGILYAGSSTVRFDVNDLNHYITGRNDDK